jgi:hypothetical protein
MATPTDNQKTLLLIARHEQIKQAILKSAGNPVSGVIAEMADEFAQAVLALEEPASTQTRVQKPDEKRALSDHPV